MGGKVVVMERFDPVGFLAAIQKFHVTHLQVVPTMFVRLLKLPERHRKAFDLSSLKFVIHAAAPCPVDVKAAMIEWLGPIIYEFYGASEGHGMTRITSDEWLRHKGSVGRPTVGVMHIVGEDGREVAPNTPGVIYFEGGKDFVYHNDPEKTAATRHAKGWSTVGDIGYADEEGYLYLTDRQSHMIISGGVNVYPQEAENILVMHPGVEDVAVIGVPDPDLGEAVKAVVLPAASARPDDALAADLIRYCRDRLAHYKCPKSVDFVTELPRLPTGKLLKRVLRERYWPAASPSA
jgi:acyl-CoA synthetase (AMP-forming)/AMP-acid ligase II